MQGPYKLVATAIIWGVVLLLLGSAIWVPVFTDNGISGGIVIPMMVILGIVATISTGMVWHSDQQTPPMLNNSVMEKAKRTQGDSRSRLMRTLDTLDDDEAAALIEDFKSRLHGGDSDGEISAVEMLRQERRRRD